MTTKSVHSARAGQRLQRIVLRFALYGGALIVGVPLALAYAMTSTLRAPISTTPTEGYETVSFVSEGLRLRGWLRKGAHDQAAFVIVHGLGDTLESYQEHARPLVDRGHTVLLFDLRAHGGSEGSRTTLGGHESEDVRAAMRYLREAELGGAGYVLMGHSMGAVAVLLAAADESDVRAVIAEAPYDTYRNTVTHHARIFFGLPSWMPWIPLSIGFAELIAGFDADAIDCVSAAERIHAPLLAIVDGEDSRMPEPVVRRIFDAHSGPKELWIAAGVDHVGAILNPDWKERIIEFLDDQGL
ncbi:MAG TPA: alpha/beta fold hydrolase [Vicinamibacteria bacterium]|nr:alpha/beta fold hydrolase [Vicinamibacteria bacterium]